MLAFIALSSQKQQGKRDGLDTSWECGGVGGGRGGMGGRSSPCYFIALSYFKRRNGFPNCVLTYELILLPHN